MTISEQLDILFDNENIKSVKLFKNPHKSDLGSSPLGEYINDTRLPDMEDEELTAVEKEGIEKDVWFVVMVEHAFEGEFVTQHHDFDKALEEMVNIVVVADYDEEQEDPMDDFLFEKGLEEVGKRIDENNRLKNEAEED